MSPAIRTWMQPLPGTGGDITLSCRGAGEPGRPLLMFLHGFPEAAFVWDELLLHFAAQGFHCLAPNLRGYEQSSAPADVADYKARLLLGDLSGLLETQAPGGRLHGLVAHDWGGALAWAFANQHPDRLDRLAILNAPHPGTFWRELRDNPAQQAASAYMGVLVQPDAPQQLSADDFALLWSFLAEAGPAGDPPAWLTGPVRDQYRAVWRTGLQGGCNYYRASPLRPPRPGEPGAAGLTLPDPVLRVNTRTLVLWGMLDRALLPGLLDGLDPWVPDLRVERHPHASHWLVHEQPDWVRERLSAFLID